MILRDADMHIVATGAMGPVRKLRKKVNNMKITMTCKENSFRKLDDPFDNGKSTKYIFLVKVDDVAEGIPMATNPREQSLKSSVATAIKESLISSP